MYLTDEQRKYYHDRDVMKDWKRNLRKIRENVQFYATDGRAVQVSSICQYVPANDEGRKAFYNYASALEDYVHWEERIEEVRNDFGFAVADLDDWDQIGDAYPETKEELAQRVADLDKELTALEGEEKEVKQALENAEQVAENWIELISRLEEDEEEED